MPYPISERSGWGGILKRGHVPVSVYSNVVVVRILPIVICIKLDTDAVVNILIPHATTRSSCTAGLGLDHKDYPVCTPRSRLRYLKRKVGAKRAIVSQ